MFKSFTPWHVHSYLFWICEPVRIPNTEWFRSGHNGPKLDQSESFPGIFQTRAEEEVSFPHWAINLKMKT